MNRSELKNKKTSVFTEVFKLLWTTLNYDMVEAAGVEPASGNIPQRLLHT